MADDRIDIEITDKVSNGPRIKIQELANAARNAHSALEQLKASLAQINTSPVAKLTAAQAKLVSANAKLAESSAKAAVSQQRLATEVQRTAGAQARAELSAVRLKAAQDRMAKSTKDNEFGFSAMKGQLLGVVAALGSLWAAFKLADEFANLENRLRSTGLEGDGLTRVMGKLKDSANETRSSLAGTVELYSRLAVSSKELGVTQNELITFTKSLNQAIILSGANATEAQAGLIQLSQGMASGTLRGDELRSVLEQLPAVADVIAKSLGVTRGQLRQLGADGKITAQDILKAFKEAGPELGERFAGQVATGSQALEVMKNKMLELAGEEGKGSLDQITNAILDLIKTLDRLRENGSLGAFAEILESQLKTVRVAITAISLVFTYVLPSILSGFNKSLSQLFSGFISLIETLSDGLSYILPESAAKGLNGMVKALRGVNDEFAKGAFDMGESAARALEDGMATIENIYAYKPPEASGEIPEAALLAGAERRRKEAEALRLAAEAEAKRKKALEQKPAIAREFVMPDKIKRIPDAYSEITGELDKMEKGLFKTNRQLEIQNKMAEYAEALKNTKGAELDLPILEKRLKLYQEQQLVTDELNKIYESTNGQLEAIAVTQTALGIAFASGAMNLEAYNLKMLETNAQAAQLRMVMGDGTWADVFNNALYSVVENYQGALPAMTEAFGNFFVSLEEGFANSIGRAIVYSEDLGTALQNVAKSAIADLISALVKMGIQTAITSAMQTEATTVALATQTAESLAAASLVANAWAPAASMTSLASFGANSAPASAGLLATSGLAQSLANVPGYQLGGYTGNVGTSQVAGVVHGREYVFDAPSVQRIGVGNLEAIRNGTTSGAPSNGNTYINNYNYTDQVPNASQVERESNFTQFKRSMSSANADRTSKRAQVAL